MPATAQTEPAATPPADDEAVELDALGLVYALARRRARERRERDSAQPTHPPKPNTAGGASTRRP